MEKEKTISRNLRFPKALYEQIEDLANANNLGFAQTTIMLLTSSIKEPKLVLPKKQDKQQNEYMKEKNNQWQKTQI